MQNIPLNKNSDQFSKQTMFQKMMGLSKANKSMDFVPGMPSWQVPDILLENLDKELQEPITDDVTYSFGTKFLLQTLAEEYSRLMERDVQWDKNVVVCPGATGVIGYLAYTSQPNDQVVMIEPYFPPYEVRARLFKGEDKFLRMRESKNGAFDIDADELTSLVNEKTRYLIINTPHNPTGTILNERHFEIIWQLTQKYKQLMIITDEVYEHIIYDRQTFPRVAAYKGLWERTISIFSAGKTYSCTGWRVGYAIGPEHLLTPIKEVQRVTNNQTNGVLMNVIARAIRDSRNPYYGFPTYYDYLRDFFTHKKDALVLALQKSTLRLRIIEPEGGYFVVADIIDSITLMPVKYFYVQGSSDDESRLSQMSDWRALPAVDYKPDEAFCRFLTTGYKVTPLPCHEFYCPDSKYGEQSDDHMYRYIRFSMSMPDDKFLELGTLLSKPMQTE